MKVIGPKEVAELLLISEGSVKDRVKPSTPRCKQIPHFALPGSGKRRIVRFHQEVVLGWIDLGCPALDSDSWRDAQKLSGPVHLPGRPIKPPGGDPRRQAPRLPGTYFAFRLPRKPGEGAWRRELGWGFLASGQP